MVPSTAAVCWGSLFAAGVVALCVQQGVSVMGQQRQTQELHGPGTLHAAVGVQAPSRAAAEACLRCTDTGGDLVWASNSNNSENEKRNSRNKTLDQTLDSEVPINRTTLSKFSQSSSCPDQAACQAVLFAVVPPPPPRPSFTQPSRLLRVPAAAARHIVHSDHHCSAEQMICR